MLSTRDTKTKTEYQFYSSLQMPGEKDIKIINQCPYDPCSDGISVQSVQKFRADMLSFD